jgi:hypothetical protein
MRAWTMNRACLTVAMSVVLACVFRAAPAEAQLNTQHLKGTVGLKSGSQPPPGVYFIAPIFFTYKSGQVKDRDGDRLPVSGELTSHAYGGGINVVTQKKLFGAFYGFQVLFQSARTIGFRAPKSMPTPARG